MLCFNNTGTHFDEDDYPIDYKYNPNDWQPEWKEASGGDTDWLESDIVIHVKHLEKEEELPQGAALLSQRAKKLLGVSTSGAWLRLLKRPSNSGLEAAEYALKVLGSRKTDKTRLPLSVRTSNEVLYISRKDFHILYNITKFDVFGDEDEWHASTNYDDGRESEQLKGCGFKLEASGDQHNIFSLSLLPEDKQYVVGQFLKEMDQYDQDINQHEQYIKRLNEKKKLCQIAIDAIISTSMDKPAPTISEESFPESYKTHYNLKEASEEYPPKEVKDCFKNTSDDFYNILYGIIDDYGIDSSTIAYLEKALFELRLIRGDGTKHTKFVKALSAWGLIGRLENLRAFTTNMSIAITNLNDGKTTNKKYPQICNKLKKGLSQPSTPTSHLFTSQR